MVLAKSALTTRILDAELFALPDHDPDGVVLLSFGAAPLKEEGAPIYRDEAGGCWILQIGCAGALYRTPI